MQDFFLNIGYVSSKIGLNITFYIYNIVEISENLKSDEFLKCFFNINKMNPKS